MDDYFLIYNTIANNAFMLFYKLLSYNNFKMIFIYCLRFLNSIYKSLILKGNNNKSHHITIYFKHFLLYYNIKSNESKK